MFRTIFRVLHGKKWKWQHFDAILLVSYTGTTVVCESFFFFFSIVLGGNMQCGLISTNKTGNCCEIG